MKFRTEYKSKRSRLTLSPARPVVMIGSCFSQNMSKIMRCHLWDALDVCGVLYNPLSIRLALATFLDPEGENKFRDSLFESNGIWQSWLFDSGFSSDREEDCVDEFLARRQKLITGLKAGKTLIVTFGTSICYFHADNDIVVGNCHKQPERMFYRRRLDIEEIVEAWRQLLADLRNQFEGIEVIFTVSPVRHLKDGFAGNVRSKSVLLLAVEEICRQHDFCDYFPAYEIVNDDLRDYRFYQEDMVHPSDEAVAYLWEKFKETYLEEDSIDILKEGYSLYKSLNHELKPGAVGKVAEIRIAENDLRIKKTYEALNILRTRCPALLDYPLGKRN